MFVLCWIGADVHSKIIASLIKGPPHGTSSCCQAICSTERKKKKKKKKVHCIGRCNKKTNIKWYVLLNKWAPSLTQLEKYMYCMKVYPKAHLIFAGECWSSAANMPEKRFDRIWKVFCFCVSAVAQLTQCAVSTQNPKWTGFCYLLSILICWSLPLSAPSSRNGGINVPTEKGCFQSLHVLFKGTRVSNEHAFWTLSWTCVLEWLWTLRWSKAEQHNVGYLGDKASSSGAAACPLAAWSPVRHCNTSLTSRHLEYLNDWVQYQSYIWL